MTESPPPETTPWHQRRTTIYVGILLAFMSLVGLLALWTPLTLDRSFLIVGGLLVLGGTYWRPSWYWEDYRALMLRRAVGDGLAATIYAIVGAAMLYFGVFTNARVFRR